MKKQGKKLAVIALSAVFALSLGGGAEQVFASETHFNDVADSSAYYYDAVCWAYDSGIISGYGDAFGPDDNVTRGQMITMIYRYYDDLAEEEGRDFGTDSTGDNSFSDVSTGAYYYTAVSWAVANGITSGTGDNQFSPERAITRGELVTFLYRANDKFGPLSTDYSSTTAFTDVADSSSYREAILWAAAKKIAAGYEDGRFGSSDSCTRAQAVTFLYRMSGEGSDSEDTAYYEKGTYVKCTYSADDDIENSAEYKKVQGACTYTGTKLTKRAGTIIGPSGKETYYNLNMSRVVELMRSSGYTDPYWVRSDGVKMFGYYVMVAANLSTRPRGTIYETSLGMAIVCDTGSAMEQNPTLTDIAVSW